MLSIKKPSYNELDPQMNKYSIFFYIVAMTESIDIQCSGFKTVMRLVSVCILSGDGPE